MHIDAYVNDINIFVKQPCLACTICNKRLDSLTLLEHDQKARDVMIRALCFLTNLLRPRFLYSLTGD